MNEVTRLLNAIRSGESGATGELLPIVYDELRRMASQRMAAEPSQHTLQPTALVHEAYLRLVGTESGKWQNRAHFFGAAAEAMRRILVDHARTKQRLKRGGGAERFELSECDRVVLPIADELLDLNDALEEFEREQPEKARVVKLKFFAGMTINEIAEALGVSVATVERHWTYSRAWLHSRIHEQ